MNVLTASTVLDALSVLIYIYVYIDIKRTRLISSHLDHLGHKGNKGFITWHKEH